MKKQKSYGWFIEGWLGLTKPEKVLTFVNLAAFLLFVVTVVYKLVNCT